MPKNRLEKQYFYSPQQKVYKEKTHTIYGSENRKNWQTNFNIQTGKVSLKNNNDNHQDSMSILMAKESDNVTIKPRYKCNIETGYKCFSQ